MEDINTVIEQNIGLAMAVLVKYHLYNDPEAHSLAMEALWKAIEDFDETLGYKMSTLITIYVQRRLGNYIKSLNKKQQLVIMSYNNTTIIDGSEETEFVDFFADPLETEAIIIRKQDNAFIRSMIEQEIQQMEGKKKQIIELWNESDFEATNKSIADKVGVAQPYVNYVISIFKRCMRERLRDNNYERF